MNLTIVANGQPYIFLEIDNFEVEAEGLTAEAKVEAGKQIFTFEEEKRNDN